MLTVVCKGLKFTNIQGIIFDKDGTLADSRQFLRELAQTRARLIDAQVPGTGEPLLMAFGVQDRTIDPIGLMAVGSHRENQIAAAAYIAETGKSWFEAMAIARQAFLKADQYLPNRAATSPLFPDTREVLARLSQGGLKLGILSADSTEAVEAFVNEHQLSDYIQLTMGVDSELTKPSPELYLRACQALDLPPQTTIMVGDSPGDIEMAKQAKAGATIGIDWIRQKTEPLKAADLVINQLTELELINE